MARRIKLAFGLVGLLAAIAVPGASAADFEGDNGPCRETPGNAALLQCPTAFVGVPYQVTIATEEGSGCFPYIWMQVVNSSLPPGLSMAQDGTISGVPTTTGLTSFWVWNHDLTAAQGGPSWCGFDDVSEREFSIPVNPGLVIVDAAVKGGSVGRPYSDTLTARRVTSLNPPTGSDASAVWSVQSGVLPPGVTLSASGALAGTPTAEGSYQFVVKADTQNGDPAATHAYTLVVRQPVAVTSPLGSRPAGEVGVRLDNTLTATGGSGTYTWSVSSGALPAGVTLDTAKGTISGAPGRAGSYSFVLTATDSEGRVASTNVALRVAARLAIKTRALKAGAVGGAYHARIAVGGGVRPLHWRIVGGKLPAGLRLSQTSGTLTGTPRAAGSFRLSVEARDALGVKARKTLVVRISA